MKKAVEAAIVFLLFTLLSLLFTWPLPLFVTQGIPGDLGDPLYVTWALGRGLSHVVPQAFSPERLSGRSIKSPGDGAEKPDTGVHDSYAREHRANAQDRPASEQITGPRGSLAGKKVASQKVAADYNPFWVRKGEARRSFWDGRIFYPTPYTLALSDHFLGNLPFSLPVWLLTRNMAMVYNLCFLLTFIISGTGMFLLTRYLTGDWRAALISGSVYAFFPNRIAHLAHLHILSSHWFPFLLLFWHKSLKEPKAASFLLFLLFSFLQSVSSAYFAVYLMAFLPVVTLLTLLKTGPFTFRRLLPWGGAFLILFLTLLPFAFPYLEIRKEIGFLGGVSPWWSATILSFLVPPRENLLWGWMNGIFGKLESYETALFPGVIALFLTIVAMKDSRGGGEPRLQQSGMRRRPRRGILTTLNVLLLVTVVLCLLVSLTGGSTIRLGIISISMHRIVIPSSVFLILLMARILLDSSLLQAIRQWGSKADPHFLPYPLLLLTGALFSFYLPSQILKLMMIPGFANTRITARTFILGMIAISVLSGYGARKLFQQHPGRKALPLLLASGIFLEGLAVPLPVAPLPFPLGHPPPVYAWLGKEPRDLVILELPMQRPGAGTDDCQAAYRAMYGALVHGERLVNGCSGYFPPHYSGILEMMEDFPSTESLQILKELEVDLILLHPSWYERKKWAETKEALRGVPALRQKQAFADTIVYEPLPEKAPAILLRDAILETARLPHPTPDNEVRVRPPEAPPVRIVRGTSSFHQNPWEGPHLAFDGKVRTFWSSDHPQQPGDFLQLELSRSQRVSKITLFLGDHASDFPRGYEILLSSDGAGWKKVASCSRALPPLGSYFRTPRNPGLAIPFPPTEARLVKILLTRRSTSSLTIHEIQIH